MPIGQCSIELLISVDKEDVRGLQLEVQRREAELTCEGLRHRIAERYITELDVVHLGDTYIRIVVVGVRFGQVLIVLTSVVVSDSRDIGTLFIPWTYPATIKFLTEYRVVIVARSELRRETLHIPEGIDEVDP